MRLLVSELVSLVIVLLLVAYFTMLERKALGYGQLRKGPNKVLVLGLGQPLLDGVKLIMKYFCSLNYSIQFMYMFVPLIIFLIMGGLWELSMSLFGIKGYMYYILGFMVLVGVMVLFVFFMGLFSGSKFSVIGAMRSLSQMISYEILMGLIMIMVVMMGLSYEVIHEGLIMYFLPVMIIWWVVCVVETNRAPVDFIEGESELVSGYNVEYGSVLFALIFLGEYGVMALYAVLTVYMFMYSDFMGLMMMVELLLVVMFLWWRLTFPRYRYDLLMYLSWWGLLPVVLMYFVSSVVILSL